jgi:hypothetical protein
VGKETKMGFLGGKFFGSGEPLPATATPGFFDKFRKKTQVDANFKVEPPPSSPATGPEPEPEPQLNAPEPEPLEPKRRFNLFKKVSSVVSGAASYFKSAERGMTKLNIGELNLEPQSQATQLEPALNQPEPDIALNPGAAEQLNAQDFKKVVAQRVEKKSKSWDLKGIGLSMGAGLVVRRGAEVLLGVHSLAVKGAVGAVAGGLSSGIREYRKQQIENNERANAIFVEISTKEMIGAYVKNLQFVDEAKFKVIQEIKDKKAEKKKLTVKDFKNFLTVDASDLLTGKMSEEEVAFRQKILAEIQELKINKREMTKSILYGAGSGAFAATVLGEALHYAYEHNFLNVNTAVHSALDYAGKYFGGVKEAASEASKQKVVKMEIFHPLKSPDVAKQLVAEAKSMVYSFHDAKIQSLTVIARRVINDYLQNEVLNVADSAQPLTHAQKIYAEDYLQKALASMHQMPGTQAKVRGDLIAKAIEAARGLSQESTDNLQAMQKIPKFRLGNAVKTFMDSNQYTSTENMTAIKKSIFNNIKQFTKPVILRGANIAHALAA